MVVVLIVMLRFLRVLRHLLDFLCRSCRCSVAGVFSLAWFSFVPCSADRLDGKDAVVCIRVRLEAQECVLTDLHPPFLTTNLK